MPVYTEKERTMSYRTNESPECTEGTCDMHKRRVRWGPAYHYLFGTDDPATNAKFAAALTITGLVLIGSGVVGNHLNNELHKRQDECFMASESVRESVRACARGGNSVRPCKARELEIHEDCLDIPR